MKSKIKIPIKKDAFMSSEVPVSQSQNLSLIYEIKAFAFNWIGSSTSHGLPSVFRTNQTYLKIIWTLCFIASTATCGLLVVNYITTYISYGTNVNLEMVKDYPSHFPAITICNLNPYYKRRSSNYINYVLQQNNLSYLINSLKHVSTNDTAFSLLSSTNSVIKSYTATDKNLNESSRRLLGWEMNEMLLSCYFNDNQCHASEFSWLQTYEYGNCYTFNGNSSSPLKITNSGPGTGLHIELFVGDGSFDAQFVYPTGAYIIIHNQSVTPLIANEGFPVSVAHESQISIKRTFTQKLAYPYNDCLYDNTSPDSYSSDLYKAIFNTLNHKTYRMKYCIRLCYQQEVIQTCNCSDASLPNPFSSKDGINTTACASSLQLACLVLFKKSFENNKLSDECMSNCPLECSSLVYSSSINLATYPTAFYSNWLQMQSNFAQKFQNNQTSTAKIQESVIKINIFYDSMEYTSIKETAAVTIDILLGNIGGVLGLFIGISMLSFIEIIELLLEIIRIVYNNRKIKRQIALKI
jgi:hypothetical protein